MNRKRRLGFDPRRFRPPNHEPNTLTPAPSPLWSIMAYFNKQFGLGRVEIRQQPAEFKNKVITTMVIKPLDDPT